MRADEASGRVLDLLGVRELSHGVAQLQEESLPPVGLHPFGRLRAGAEHARDPAVVAAARCVGKGEMRLLGKAVALHRQRDVVAIVLSPAKARSRIGPTSSMISAQTSAKGCPKAFGCRLPHIGA